MPFYVINLHRTDEDRSSSSSNAHEAVQRLHEAEAAGWIVVSILRNDILMDEHSLRDDADREDRYFGSRPAEAKPSLPRPSTMLWLTSGPGARPSAEALPSDI